MAVIETVMANTTLLECTRGKARKFWEVRVEGPDVVVRFGRLGTEGQIKKKKLSTRADATREAEHLVAQKLAKGYVRAGLRRATRSMPPEASRGNGSAKRAASTEHVVEAFVAWFEQARSLLKAPARSPRSVAYAKGVLTLKMTQKEIVLGNPSAPGALFASIYRDESKVLERVCLDPPGRWNDVVTLLRCEGRAHSLYMTLVEAIHAAGDREEARLAWLRAKSPLDPDDRKEALFHTLFAGMPTSKLVASASSSAAMFSKRLPMASSKDPVEALVVAHELYDFMDDALNDVAGTGKRERDLIAKIDGAVGALASSDSLAVREMAKLIRLQFARSAAFLRDAPHGYRGRFPYPAP